MFSRLLALCVIATTSLLLLACSGAETRTDASGRSLPSENAAEDAIEASLEAFNSACISPQAVSGGETFPVTLIEPDTTRPTVAVRQLLTLEDAGLVTSNRVVDDRQLVKNTFQLTDDGEEAIQTVYQFRGWQSALCYAQPEIVRIDTIYALRQRSPRPLAEVAFAYQLVDVAEWVRRDDVQQSFPDIRDELATVGTTQTDRQTVVLTDDGWRALRVIRRTEGTEAPAPGDPAPANGNATNGQN